MVVNLPLSLIGLCGFAMVLFVLIASRNGSQFFEALPGSIWIAVGLWLEYRYYKTFSCDFEHKSERTTWLVSTCYNALALAFILVAIIVGKEEGRFYALFALIYPGYFLVISIISLLRLRQMDTDEVLEYESQQVENS